MDDNLKYYGFYGRKGNTDNINYRKNYIPSIDPQVNNKEFGVYVHDFFEEIPKHLNYQYNISGKYGKHYGNINNLTFIPIDSLSEKEKNKVQSLINVCYSFYIDDSNTKISWSKLHALGREYMYSGYNSELSKTIMDLIAEEANIIADKINDISDSKYNLLKIQSKRKCDNIHNIHNIDKKEDVSHNYNKIILEDYFINQNEKQLILGFGRNNDIQQYKNNPKIFNDPWLSRSSELGFYVWNIMINKATIKCILDNNPILFPIQIILSTNPNYLFYEQIEKSNNIKYIGYFIARINLDKLENTQIIDPECERLYDYTFNKIQDSKEQYFVIFIFKNEDKNIKYDIDRYILTDFRMQRIHWGDLTRSKRVLFIEIEQLMCSLLYEKTYFYLLSEYETGEMNNIIQKCNSQNEEITNVINNKKNNKDCFEAWLHSSTFKLLNNNKIKLKGQSYNIFVSKKKIEDIQKELENKIQCFLPVNKDFKHLLITEKIDNDTVKEYILFPCHFKWETIINTNNDKKYGNKKTFVLKHGYLDLVNDDNLTRNNPKYFDSEQYYKKELCINNNCIFNRDYIMHSIKHINLFNNNNISNPSNYNEIKNNLIQQNGGYKDFNSLIKIFNKIKLYKQNFKNIILSNKSLYLDNKEIYNRYLGFNIMHIFDNNINTTDIYSNTSNYINNNLFFLPLMQHIINGNILIISNNINVLVILDKYLNINISNITLVLVNININNLINIYSIKFINKDKINIYYFGNLIKVELINNIINFFFNIKFANIILDIVDNNNQIFYNILGIKICKKLLNYKGSYIQFNKIPDPKDNLIYLYYFIFKCFRYNYYENHTNYLLKDNMYSLIYHKIFEYNLNDEEEIIIDQLLNNNSINLSSKISFHKLFIDFIYIKYLSMFYNLENYAEKIFKISYNIIENKINEQSGGYIINNNLNVNTKYTCTFLDKQLFLLHLNLLTKVCLYENKKLDDFYIYYDNNHYGYYQDILKHMFQNITWKNYYDKTKKCIFISNNIHFYHKIKPKYALVDFKPDANNNFFDGEILYTLYPFSNNNFKILLCEYNKIKQYSYNVFQELLDNNKLLNLYYSSDFYNINKIIPIKYLELIPGYINNFECILEYKIVYNYFYHIHNISDHHIIINKFFDININNEFLITCVLNNFNNNIMFKNIIQLNIEQYAKHQIQLLKDYGLEVFDNNKINKAINILKKYASDKTYIHIL